MHYQLALQIEGELFQAVVEAHLFEDSKVFVDAIPKREPVQILREYRDKRRMKGFSLKKFILENFVLPEVVEILPRKDVDMFEYIDLSWDLFLKEFKPVSDATWLSLPEKQLVPGGRFRECYYWDNYFVMEGLFVSKREDLIEKLLKNFAYMIDKYGFIPNGNRLYYLTRSQQPYFSLMLSALFREGREKLALSYYPQLLKEYDFWMRGQELLGEDSSVHHRVVLLEGFVLNRYYDETNHPRPESYREDLQLFKKATQEQGLDLYRNIKAACESGWDFSSRWCREPCQLESICTTELLPLDLNCLIYHMELLLYQFGDQLGHEKTCHFKKLAEKRKEVILNYFWDKKRKYFFDYDFRKKRRTECYSLAAVMPLFMKIATPSQASEVAKYLEEHLLLEGGFVTTSVRSGMQWDYPYGWAPLQFLAYIGLKNYGFDELANRAARAFIMTCQKNYHSYGKLFEKYNLENVFERKTVGEYSLQEGFGWTNGILKVFQKALQNR